MTINKNERSYIKQFGRVANRDHKPQLDQIHDGDEVIGQIETIWSELGSCWIFTGVVFNSEGAFRLDHDTWMDAHKWIDTKRLEYNRHKSFGAYLEFMLSDMSMTKTKLGELVGVSRQSIHDWINDEYLPDVPNFIKLARLYSKWSSCDVNTILLDMSESII